MRRLPLTVLAAVVAVLVIGACEGGGDEGAGLDLSTCGELEYGGSGEPAALIVSDLPLQGDSAERSKQQVEAIRLELERRDFKAGSVTVGFQSCDDTIADTGLWDEQICRSNAEGYAGQPDVLGVIGTYNSGCAAIEIPILSKASLAMVSPGNTAVCLTRKSKGCEDGQPESLYTGGRNYVRVVPNDAFQGAALAQFVRDQGRKRPYVLYAADDPTSTGQAQNFRGAAEELGVKLAGYTTWDPKGKSFTTLFEKVKKSGADAVVLAGLTEQSGAQLIKDKVAVLGPNDKFTLIAFDGFTQQSTIDEAGPASGGMFSSTPGRAPEALTGDGKTLVGELKERTGGKPVELFAPYGGEAAAVLLDAITKAGPDRAAVVKALFEEARPESGILGSYRFDPNGDPTVGPVTVFKAGKTFEVDTEVRPPTGLVDAAAG